MRKVVGIVGGIIAAGALTWSGLFYYRNLRGASPAVRAPREDITQLLRHPERSEGSPANVGNADKLRDSSAAPQNDGVAGMPLKLPPGFSIEIFAKDLGKPRVMTWGPDGQMLVSIPSQGRVAALPDRNGDGVADEVVTVVDGLNAPHGLAPKCSDSAHCLLYIAERDKIAEYDYDSLKRRAVFRRKIVNLPEGGNHVTRTIMFMPGADPEALLVSVGSSCNVCEEKDGWRASITLVTLDGRIEPYAKGLRNAVFMTTHPVTGQQWVTEMGRDFLGDDLPPDEINIVHYRRHYGWPYCYGKQVHDAEFDPRGEKEEFCQTTKPSYIDIPAYSAPLGLAFIPTEGWPQEYWYDLLVAYHGSWNRSEPTGYKIVRYKLDAQGNLESVEDFITGWLQPDGTALGRPVDILVQPGGVMYISDDKAGVIYKVIYTGK